ncbi:thiol-activated cytolysin family protein [Streptomyces noursei]|uniref:thiol-activated cytolysin family protein n=1 Tax=Streptomyces noursei TaxID=1971 RepID=UPI0016777C8F|nr:thiol-activated cytolysin family protein [Streptomyces noursei]MCZ1014154.1 thiol-activated cytolysin family protein [Streptomyces noursei]GGX24021.1 hypothetical protein GCM10010341_51530 [Streptomyces noursei]
MTQTASDGQSGGPSYSLTLVDGGLSLSWPPVDGADRYEVTRLDAPSGSDVQATDSPSLLWASDDEGSGAQDGVPPAFQILALRGSAPVSTFVLAGDENLDAPVNMSTYVLSLDKWETIAPQVQTTERKPLGEPEQHHEQVAGEDYLVTTQRWSLSKTPKYLAVANPNADVLWPGALVQGLPASHGALSELVITERTPIEISCSALHIEKGDALIDRPRASAVVKAIREMVQGGEGRSETMYYDMVEASSIQSALLEMNVSASYMGFTAEADGRIEKKHDERTIVAVFLQGAYTVSCDGKDTPRDWFTDKLTWGKVKELEELGRIGKGNPPLYISSVTYGRSLLFALNTTADTLKAKAAIKASYNGMADVSAEVRAEYEQILNTSSVTILSQGGNPDDISKMVKEAKLQEYFGTTPKLDQYVPMTFTLKSLLTGDIAQMGETANFTVITRTRQRPSGTVRIRPVRMTVKSHVAGFGGVFGPMRLRLNGAGIDGTLADGATTYPSSAGWLWKPDPQSERPTFKLQCEHENIWFPLFVSLQPGDLNKTEVQTVRAGVAAGMRFGNVHIDAAAEVEFSFRIES